MKNEDVIAMNHESTRKLEKLSRMVAVSRRDVAKFASLLQEAFPDQPEQNSATVDALASKRIDEIVGVASESLRDGLSQLDSRFKAHMNGKPA